MSELPDRAFVEHCLELIDNLPIPDTDKDFVEAPTIPGGGVSTADLREAYELLPESRRQQLSMLWLGFMNACNAATATRQSLKLAFEPIRAALGMSQRLPIFSDLTTSADRRALSRIAVDSEGQFTRDGKPISESEVLRMVDVASVAPDAGIRTPSARASHAYEPVRGRETRRRCWPAYGIATAAGVVAVLCGAWAVYVDTLYSEQLVRNQRASREPVQACTVASRPENTHELTLTSDEPTRVVVVDERWHYDVVLTLERDELHDRSDAMVLSLDESTIGPGGVTLKILGESTRLELRLED